MQSLCSLAAAAAAQIGFVMSSLKLSYQVTFGFTASLFFVNLVLVRVLRTPTRHSSPNASTLRDARC